MDFSLLIEGKKPEKKLSLGDAPYTYARISVMKSRLLKRDDYNRLMKMKLSDVIKFLQETEYKKEIDEMAVSYSGIELIELALYKNLAKTFLKLKRIAEYDDLRLVMEEYMKRNDVWNVKTILRAKLIKEKEETIKDLLMPIGELGEKFLGELMKKDSVEEIITSLKFLGKDQIKEALDFFRENKSLFAIENMLDKFYYHNAIEFSKRMPRQGEFFRDFIENEVDIKNIKTILRLKKEGMSREDIEGFLFYFGGKLGRHGLLRLAKSEDVESMINILKKLGYGKVLKDIYDKAKKDIFLVELKLNKHLLDSQILLLHQNPLSVDVVLGYMFAKEIEIRNLRTIIKGRQLSLREDFIENELVIGG